MLDSELIVRRSFELHQKPGQKKYAPKMLLNKVIKTIGDTGFIENDETEDHTTIKKKKRKAKVWQRINDGRKICSICVKMHSQRMNLIIGPRMIQTGFSWKRPQSNDCTPPSSLWRSTACNVQMIFKKKKRTFCFFLFFIFITKPPNIFISILRNR